MTFLWGVLSSLTAITLVWFCKWLKDPILNRNAVRIDGVWEIYETQKSRKIKSGEIIIKQRGSSITAESHREKTRSGSRNDRKFRYKGHIHKDQMTLVFEDVSGKGFDCGTYVFIVQNNKIEMEGMATFHGKQENEIVSERRYLKKSIKPAS